MSGFFSDDSTDQDGCNQSQPAVYADLTDRSVEDFQECDAQAEQQLWEALQLLDEALFQSGVNEPRVPTNQPPPGVQDRYTRLQPDRQTYRPTKEQAAEWATLQPHLWLKGRQLIPEVHNSVQWLEVPAVAGQVDRLAHMDISLPISQPSTGQDSVKEQAMASDEHPASTDSKDALTVVGTAIKLVPRPQKWCEEEVIAQHGNYEEVFAIQHDAWEAHAPRSNRANRDFRRTAVGLPPVSPVCAVEEELMEQALQHTWAKLLPSAYPAIAARVAEKLESRKAAQTPAEAVAKVSEVLWREGERWPWPDCDGNTVMHESEDSEFAELPCLASQVHERRHLVTRLHQP